ncbi:restriction endonuclease subunit S [Megamonas funiformis]|uniref:restriction endonuclease subunit S n=2 Tax=Megamonas funiformis TaxID=437897 RepID=UPI0015FD5047|nr:restriction endonuclease subunit S [Megamonas funiformis]
MAKKKQIELTIEEKLQNALVPKEEQPYKIPNNWCWVRLGNITQIKGGKRIPKGTSLLKENTGYKYIRVTDMKNGTVLNDDIHYISKDIYNKISNYTISKNDIYITCAGTIGRVGIIPVEFDGANLTENADKIIIKHINKNLLVKVLSSYIVQKQIQEVITTGCQPKLAIKKIEQLKIPLPPINEQQRIVERIEFLFVKLDRAKELIENTLAQFEQNKMAILHKAFIGELTAKWRKENNIDLSSWENGILMDFCKINPKKINTKEFDDDMIVSFIPMPCVSDIWGKIIKKELRKLGEVKKGYTNFCEGDVLFAKITPCMENGKSAIVDKLENDIGFGSTEFYVLRCDENKLNNKYLHYFVRQKTFRDEAKGEMTGAVGQQRVPKTFLENYKMKVPTIEEQQEIVNILDKLLAKYNKIKNLEQQLEKIELLKKAILAKAFRGELGTNNPDEESAENLLKEILAEK